MSFINGDGGNSSPGDRRIWLDVGDDNSDQDENGAKFSSQSSQSGQETGPSHNGGQSQDNGNEGDESQDQDDGDQDEVDTRSPYFDTAANVYERQKYPVKKRKKEEFNGEDGSPEKDREDIEEGSDNENGSAKSAYGGKKRRAAVYRHATGTSAYFLNAVYGQLRGTKRVSSAVMSEYKPVIDPNRSPIQDKDEPKESAPTLKKNRSGSLLPRAPNGNDSEAKKEQASRGTPGTRKPVYKPAAAGLSDQSIDDETERLKNIVERDILDTTLINVTWDEIAGLGKVKNIIQEIVVWPMLRPELFTGLRALPRGLLLFGPPGTGKTTLGRCIASQAKATFYCISASSLTSKWVGENEKLVRALFESARAHQPAVVFIDEIDALLSNRVDGEHDSTRRLKTQFFTELDGAKTFSEERVLVVGATNRPGDLDDAARRRLTKRLYVPLPDQTGRVEMMENLLKRESHSLTPGDIQAIAERTEGFSCDDLKKMCQEAALGPVRRVFDLAAVSTEQLPPITAEDFDDALRLVRPSVGKEQLAQYEEFDRRFGSAGAGT